MRVPRSTYRLQLGPHLTLADATRLVPYLDRLAISDLYLSPIGKARTGSTHNYDVVDPNEIDPKLGTRADLESLSAQARERGMGVICDIVPNHMAASWENPWWWDVLLNGPQSRHAHTFDIDWERGNGKLVLPILADELDRVLDDLRIERTKHGAVLRYHEHRFPIRGVARGDLRSTLDAQPYRLAFWRTGQREINYRRFFDITDLVATRTDDPATVDATHRLVFELLDAGTITGLRIDHIDGLRDPVAYLRTLVERVPPHTYVVVEKILARDECLPDDWPCAGTTGYELIDSGEGAFVDAAGVKQLRVLATELTGTRRRFRDIARTAKREVLETMFASELDTLTDRIARGAVASRPEVRRGLVQATAALPVYRTYVTDRGASSIDRTRIEQATEAVGDGQTRTLLHRALLGGDLDAVSRWQQLCAPAAAKGVEDTALYRDIALISRNEVGADPSLPTNTVDAFHDFNVRRLRTSPATMNASSTHDTKRGEDVRARLDVLSEIPDEWASAVRRWIAANARLRTSDGAPDRTDELFLYQTLAGTWPVHASQRAAYGRRIRDYMRKAAREAKRRTDWLDPDAAYEDTLDRFVRGVLGKDNDAFRHDIDAVAATLALHGAVNSLARLVVKVCAPGVPDLYQGAEGWHLRLVDPDNRSPVDFDARERALTRIEHAFADDPERLARSLLERWPDGNVKLFGTWRALTVRREHHDTFATGEYVPLRAAGTRRRNILAFARRLGPRWVLACVPRFSTEVSRNAFAIGDAWNDTLALPRGAPRAWTDAFTRRKLESTEHTLPIADLLRSFPVALLVSNGGDT